MCSSSLTIRAFLCIFWIFFIYISSSSVLSGYFYVSLDLAAVADVWILINFAVTQLLSDPVLGVKAWSPCRSLVSALVFFPLSSWNQLSTFLHVTNVCSDSARTRKLEKGLGTRLSANIWVMKHWIKYTRPSFDALHVTNYNTLRDIMHIVCKCYE